LKENEKKAVQADEKSAVSKKKNKKNKNRTVVAAVICSLAVLAIASASFVLLSMQADKKEKTMIDSTAAATPDEPEVKLEQVQYYIDENQYKIDFDPLQEDIETTIDNVKQIAGGEWSVYISVPSSNSTLSINQKKMQAASVIKLFVMGAVYDDYDAIIKKYGEDEVEELIEQMIVVSDNDCADELVTMIGRGNSKTGKKAVTDYCQKLGLSNTVMGRLIHENDDVNDNFTTTEDTAHFLEMILDGELPHSKEMLRHLERQERKSKIPAGIPTSVTIANKTGELEDVQNDAAIVFAKQPYIICVMSDGVLDYQTPIDAIVEISNESYNYLVTKM